MNDLIAFIEDKIAQSAAIEARAKTLLHDNADQEGYRQAMVSKAQLLANLARDAAPKLMSLPVSMRPAIEHRLDMFSQSAKRSLEIGSVFYMSALLYPDEHKPGEPNNLELWLADLKRS